MANTGFTLAGAGANEDSGAADEPWVNPGNILSSDNVYSTIATMTPVPPDFTDYLNATSFGFAIPSGATIDGIIARIERSVIIVGAFNVVDQTVQLLKAGVRTGTNKADTTTNWPTVDTNKDYGTSTDLWGTTWTPAEINATNFGLSLRCTNPAGADDDGTLQVDAVSIDVYYTDAGGAAAKRTLALMGVG